MLGRGEDMNDIAKRCLRILAIIANGVVWAFAASGLLKYFFGVCSWFWC
jgi:hypothetical protein